MRVIRINAVYGISSTGRTVMQLDRSLRAGGVESSTVYFAGSGTENDLRINSGRGVKLHSLMARLTGKSGYYSACATKKLLKYLEEQRPDIVHLHNLHSNFVDLPMLFKFLSAKHIPVAVTLDDCWWYTGKCSHYTADGCGRWLTGCGSCPRLKKDIPSWFFDRTAKMLADKKKWFASVSPLAVIGVSDWITNEARKTFFNDADIVERVYNWIDTDVFTPRDTDIKNRYGLEGKFVLLAVASHWMDSKGLTDLIKLSRVLPDDMALVMIGAVPGDRAGELCRIVSIPATDSQDALAEWYSAADAFISLSKEESFGKVAAEALACGTPIIMTNTTASPELVGENCGAVLEDTEPEKVIAAARRLRAAGKADMSAGCREFALKNFDMDSRIADVLGIYNRLIEIRKGAGEC